MAKMKEAESQLVAFNIILHSGNARTSIHEAMQNMREGRFDTANTNLEEASAELVLAHQSQTELLQKFSHGVTIEMQIIMVHAQDHLMTTMTLQEVAKEMEFIYKRLEGEKYEEIGNEKT